MGKEDLFPGLNRRDFMKTCITVSAMLGLPIGMVSKVAAAAQKADSRPAVIWLHFQECTGCSESQLR
jgi:hydrogenase small subunit